MSNYFLIKNNKVVNYIVADEDFMENIKDEYDFYILENNENKNASVGDTAYIENNIWKFEKPETPLPTVQDMPVEPFDVTKAIQELTEQLQRLQQYQEFSSTTISEEITGE
jgi:hypothetical protein